MTRHHTITLALTVCLTAGLASAAPVEHKYVESRNPAPPTLTVAFPKTDAKTAGINAAALDRLVKRAEETHSDSLVVLRDGKLVGDWRFGKPREPIEIMSVTKSVANLAIGRLVTTGRLFSTDVPVSTWFPEWKQGKKASVTISNLLNQTSGLKADPSAQEVYNSADILRLALDAPLAHDPGTDFFYNNKAVNLLGGIVQKVSGKRLDEYMRDEVFAPLGIDRFAWMRDPAGNPHVMAGLKLDALDLAKIGQLMLNRGVWNGKQIVSAKWVDTSVHPAQPFQPNYGLLWWTVNQWSKLKLDDETLAAWKKGDAAPGFLDKMATLKDKDLTQEELGHALDTLFGPGQGMTAYTQNVRAKGLPNPKRSVGPQIGFSGNGYLGQYIVVLPTPKIVAIRQIRSESYKGDQDSFDDFQALVRGLVP
jgi:CubicO group peptidase (beta-lactamase class C family)